MENVYTQWTDEQWNLVQQTVRDEARKVRIAASFLPLHGPLAPDAETVSLQEVQTLQVNNPQRGEPPNRLTVNDSGTRRLTTVSVYVYLTTAQASQADLSSGLIMFRRAANLIARVEDGIVFRGQQGVAMPPEGDPILPNIFTITGGEMFRGILSRAIYERNRHRISAGTPGRPIDGNVLVARIGEAITDLERRGHQPPFALVLGSTLYDVAHSPTNSLVMPADRIKPWLQRDQLLLRSSTIPHNQGVLVSLAGDPIDLVVASEISVKFLQITTDPLLLFRVSQRFTLRVKQPSAVMALIPG